MSNSVNKNDEQVKPGAASDNASPTKASSQTQYSRVRTITTTLRNRREVFRLLALCEATGYPLLLEGPPGVGKTQSVRDYANSLINQEEHKEKVFMIEVDEDTRASAIKGQVDMQKLYEEKKFSLYSPIVDSDIVIINEVDKATSGLRNSMLSCMNEKILFQGAEQVPLNWNLWVATCNEIPKEERGNHFWDRFPIRYKVNRTDRQQIEKFVTGGKKPHTFSLVVPTKEEIDAINIPDQYMSKFIEIAYDDCTDRTLTYMPEIVKAISIIWNCSLKRAMNKAAALMISLTAAKKLSSQIQSPMMKSLLNRLSTIARYRDPKKSRQAFKELAIEVEKSYKSGSLSKEEFEEFKDGISNPDQYLDLG